MTKHLYRFLCQALESRDGGRSWHERVHVIRISGRAGTFLREFSVRMPARVRFRHARANNTRTQLLANDFEGVEDKLRTAATASPKHALLFAQIAFARAVLSLSLPVCLLHPPGSCCSVASVIQLRVHGGSETGRRGSTLALLGR